MNYAPHWSVLWLMYLATFTALGLAIAATFGTAPHDAHQDDAIHALQTAVAARPSP